VLEPARGLDQYFPIPIGVARFYDLDLAELYNVAHHAPLETNDLSDHDRNWQSKSLSVLDDLPDLKERIRVEVEQYKDQILGCNSTPFAFTTSWWTRTDPGGSCEWHEHRNSWISGVLYINGGPKWGSFAVHSPLDYRPSILVTPDVWNKYNTQVYEIDPEPGMLLLFQSNLRHRIYWHHGDAPRYSLAFNTYPHGLFGNRDSVVSVSVDDIGLELT